MLTLTAHRCAAATPSLYRSVDLRQQSQRARFDEYLCTILSLFLRHPEISNQVRHVAASMPDRRATRYDMIVSGEELPQFNRHIGETFPHMLAQPSPSEAEAHADAEASEVAAGGEKGDDVPDDASNWSTTDSSQDEGLDITEIDAEGRLTERGTEMQRWVLLTILLSRMSKLETLDIEVEATPVCPEAFDVILRYNERAAWERLPNIENVCFGCTSVAWRYPFSDGIFMFPGTKALYLHRVRSGTYMVFTGAPRSLALTHLELRDCRMAPPELTRIVNAIKTLKCFIYEVGEARSIPQRWQHISYRSVRQSLEPHRHNLEDIWIDYPHDYHFDEMSTDDTRPIGSFTQFTALKRLRIASTFIFGFVWSELVDTRRLVESLPKQLEHLHLTHADEDEETQEGVELLLTAKRQGKFRKLKYLRLDMSILWLNDRAIEFSLLLHMAKDVGVEMELFDNHSESRIELDRIWEAVASRGFAGLNRKECGWGFDEEVEWPVRPSGCMKRPEYEKIPLAASLRPSNSGWFVASTISMDW